MHRLREQWERLRLHEDVELHIRRLASVRKKAFKVFAALILEAAYEATLWAAVANAQRGSSRRVLLTLVGGGVFGNDTQWTHAGLLRALGLRRDLDLEVMLVSKRAPTTAMRSLSREFA